MLHAAISVIRVRTLQSGAATNMGRYDVRPCPCGSGHASSWLFDCKGIPVARVCNICESATMKKYNPIIFTGYTQADIDEQIEEDE
jgi:hypothetical protein